jgi:S1-C subfamily serine protease
VSNWRAFFAFFLIWNTSAFAQTDETDQFRQAVNYVFLGNTGGFPIADGPLILAANQQKCVVEVQWLGTSRSAPSQQKYFLKNFLPEATGVRQLRYGESAQYGNYPSRLVVVASGDSPVAAIYQPRIKAFDTVNKIEFGIPGDKERSLNALSLILSKYCPPGTSSTQFKPRQEKSSGTAFFVSTDGYLVTNAHVVESCKTLRVVDATQSKIPVQIVRMSKSDDLALLKSDTKRSSAASFRGSAQINQGEIVIAYGYPLAGLLASGGNVSTGVVTALSGLRDDPREMQISTPVQPGNSGGPLVDTKGAMIGVIVAKLDALAVARITSDIPQNINFAVKGSAVTNLLDASGVKYTRTAQQQELSVEAVTQQLREYTVKLECN